jgi:hypothetical protein
LTPIAVKQIKARRVSASSHPVIRDAAKTYSLQTFCANPGAGLHETKGLADVSKGRKKHHRQLTNFTGNYRNPQVFGWALWITKVFIISNLYKDGEAPLQECAFLLPGGNLPGCFAKLPLQNVLAQQDLGS